MANIVSLAEVRAEGVSASVYSDDRVNALCTYATKYIERATGQWFEDRDLTLYLDGRGTDVLLLPIPAIEVTSITVGTADSGASVDVDTILIESAPRNPMLVMAPSALPSGRGSLGVTFATGRRNVTVVGTFGQVESDGYGGYVAPAPIKRAAIRLIIRELGLLGDASAQEERKRANLRSETTDGHSYSLAEMAVSGGASGDPEVDRLLAMYRRPLFGGLL